MDDYPRHIEEYREIGLNLRHYSNMQFVNLTLALAGQAALFSVAFRTPPVAGAAKVVVAVGGMMMAVLFYVSEHRIRAYWRSYFKRAEVLETRTGFSQYANAPNNAKVTSGNAIRLLFVVLVLFWGTSAFVPGMFG